MKKSTIGAVAALFAAMGAMAAVNWLQAHETQARMAELQRLGERRAESASMRIALESFRGRSVSFWRMSPGEIAGVKSELRSRLADGIGRLQRLEPSAEDRALEQQVGDRVSELLFKKPSAREYDPLLGLLDQIDTQAARRVSELREAQASGDERALRALALALGVGAATIFVSLLHAYFASHRPLRRLRARAAELRSGAPRTEGSKPLKGIHGEIEAALDDLAATVESQRRERHQFVNAIASDLRAPLVTLQTGAGLLSRALEGGPGAMGIDERQRGHALEAVRRSIYRLERSLESLGDLLDADRELRLDEKVVDLRDVVSEVARVFGGSGSGHEVSCSVPPGPLWTMVDPERFERALVLLASKLLAQLPQGGAIHLSLSRVSSGSFRGVELLIQDSERASGARHSTGPEQELIRHWVGENGFAMALVHRIVRAHGGTVTASGVAGTGVLFSLRLPQERVATGWSASPATALRASALDLARITSVSGAASGA